MESESDEAEEIAEIIENYEANRSGEDRCYHSANAMYIAVVSAGAFKF